MSQTINEIRKIDRAKLIRPSYGQTSLSFWEPEFDSMLQNLDLIQKYWSKVDYKTNNQVQNALTDILAQLQILLKYDENQFVTNRIPITKQISLLFAAVKEHYSKYVTEAIVESGFLAKIDFKTEFETLKNDLKQLSDETLVKVKEESNDLIVYAQKKAEEIESTVRKTVQEISVKEAQDQFRDAAANNGTNIKTWGIITGSLILVFIILITAFLLVNLPDYWTWKMIYYSALRITLLGFIGTLLAFSLKILKSHLHMKEHNLHRQRIANSMASFCESATSKEQRDLILSKLIDSVSTFGNSGMITNDDEGNSKITIDNITRSLSAIKPNVT